MFAFLPPKSGRKEGFPGKMVCFAFAHMYLESLPTDRPPFQPWLYVVDFNFTRKAPPLPSVAAVVSLEPWPQVFVPQFFLAVGRGGLK